jgi:hypothetical protein
MVGLYLQCPACLHGICGLLLAHCSPVFGYQYNLQPELGENLHSGAVSETPKFHTY